ncbi:TadE/TadG family type IV pilus assembly protein [Phenylobacterium sp.]|jgi:Flp pilus assembly protein TadG|uniref:TadE/TadG family type IV pilus assembly protein n=1 Tax=Phenylobacterium sp. TaxID=1871053 RepID=UPI002F40131F
MPTAHLTPLRRFIRWARDARGMAAVEFALIAPVMVLLYFGLAEFTMALMAQRRISHVASVIADLVSQTPQVTNSNVGDIFTVGGAILSPFAAGPLQMRITSVVADNNAVPKVAWSKGQGLTALAVNATVTVPNNLLTPGDSVVMADVQYSYTSPLQVVLPNALTFTSTFYLRPRRSPSVALIAG